MRSRGSTDGRCQMAGCIAVCISSPHLDMGRYCMINVSFSSLFLIFLNCLWHPKDNNQETIFFFLLSGPSRCSVEGQPSGET